MKNIVFDIFSFIGTISLHVKYRCDMLNLLGGSGLKLRNTPVCTLRLVINLRVVAGQVDINVFCRCYFVTIFSFNESCIDTTNLSLLYFSNILTIKIINLQRLINIHKLKYKRMKVTMKRHNTAWIICSYFIITRIMMSDGGVRANIDN